MLALEVLVCAAAVVILTPVLVLSVEVLAALFSKGGGHEGAPARPRLAVVIPAHDEASGIRDTIESLIPQLQSGDRIVVVADNCTDETAAVASAAGAEVITRHDPSNRGKGYALNHGVRYLERDPPAVVLIVDADCWVIAGSVDCLARVCARTDRPAQALNLSHAPPGAGVKMRIAEFASVLKNQVRALGLRQMGLPCQLTGTGMAFPWACIRRVTLATGHIVEDLKLGLDLAGIGYPPLLCPEAQVASYFPASEEGFKTQRTRWERGYLGVLARDAPAILWKSVRARDPQLLALGLDLCVPPIALLTLSATAVWIASILLFAVARMELPLLIATAAIGLLAFSVLAAWARYGRRVVSAGTLVFGIVYAVWKIPLYVGFLVFRRIGWVRTKRDDG